MFARLSQLRKERAQGDKGFTLIELLVVVVILGILIAIAIPLYLNYRKGANDSAAKSDLRGAVSVLEQCQTDNNSYPTASFTLTGTGAAGTCTAQTINLSDGTTFQYTASTTTPVTYIAVTTNSKGATKFYCYNSSKGGSVALISPAPSAITSATC